MIQLQENAWADGRKDGWKDGQTIFHRTLVANARGPKSPYSVEVCFCSVYISTLWVCKGLRQHLFIQSSVFYNALRNKFYSCTNKIMYSKSHSFMQFIIVSSGSYFLSNSPISLSPRMSLF